MDPDFVKLLVGLFGILQSSLEFVTAAVTGQKCIAPPHIISGIYKEFLEVGGSHYDFR
jgi:hypothetical protein